MSKVFCAGIWFLWQENPLQLGWISQVALTVKKPSAKAGDVRGLSSIPQWGRSPRGGHGNPRQYSCSRIPWTEEAGWLQSRGLHRNGHNWSNLIQMYNLGRFLLLASSGYQEPYQTSFLEVVLKPVFSLGSSPQHPSLYGTFRLWNNSLCNLADE